MSQVFISYSRRDQNDVLLLAQKLEDAGHKVWLDKSAIQGGEKWQEEIVRGIERADVFVIVLSPQSIESENVEKELGLAYVTNKTILPVMLHRVVAPARLQYALIGLQTIDISDLDIEVSCHRLLSAIRSPGRRTGRVYLDTLWRDKLPKYLYFLILIVIGILDQHRQIQWGVSIATLGGVAFWGVRRWLINHRLKKSGVLISTELKGFIRLASQRSYRIATWWQNPETGRRHEFYSRKIPSDIAEFVERRIPVIVDQRNITRYRVDLSFLPKEPRGALGASSRSELTGTEGRSPSEGAAVPGPIFVNHAKEDKHAVGLLIRKLEAAGHTVCTPDRAGGEGVADQEEVNDRIARARLVLHVLSPDSVGSDVVRSELDLALAKGKRIITAVLHRTITPEEMDYALVGVQHVDLSEDFETGLMHLLEILSVDTSIATVLPETMAAACAAFVRRCLRIIGMWTAIFFSQFILVGLLILQYATKVLPAGLRPSLLKRITKAALWLDRKMKGEDELEDRGTVLLTEYKHVQAEEDDGNRVRILSQWRDPLSGQLYLFRSKWLSSGAREYIKTKTIAVYVDPRNLRRYSMDLSFLPEDKQPQALDSAPVVRLQLLTGSRSGGRQIFSVPKPQNPASVLRQNDDAADKRVFISYSQESADKAGLLIQGLEDGGYEVVNRICVDGSRPGEAETKSSIGLARTFLIVVPSAAANDLSLKAMELRHACAIKRRIIPVTFDDSEVPPSMQLSLAGIQHIDVTQDKEAGIRLLINALSRRNTGGVAVPNPAGEFPRATSKGRARRVLSGAILGALWWSIGSALGIVLLKRDPGMQVNVSAAVLFGLVFGGGLGAVFYRPRPKIYVLLPVALLFVALYFGLMLAFTGDNPTTLLAPLLGIAVFIASKQIEAHSFNYRLKKKGQLLLTEYKGLQYDESETHNDKHYFQVVSQWRNPVTDEVYTFVSEDFARDPSEQIRSSTIAVYVDPSNPNDYYMDLSFSAGTGFGEQDVEQPMVGIRSRLWRSIEGVALGVILFVVGLPVVWLNEASAVRTARALQQGAKVVLDVSSAQVDPANEGKLVHVTGSATTAETITDPLFGVSTHAIKLRRTVEMYQWRETSSKSTNPDSEVAETSYTYHPIWSEEPINSDAFNEPGGHRNPAMPFRSAEFVAGVVNLGALRLNRHMVGQLRGSDSVDVSQAKLPDSVRTGASRVESGFQIGDLVSPRIGDLRITFQQLRSAEVSIISRQIRNTFEPYRTASGGSVELVVMGINSADNMFASAQSENTFGLRTWLLRCLGFVLMFVGLKLVLSPISILGDAVPIVGRLLRFGVAIVCILVALCLSLVIIAVAWIAFRPLVGSWLLAGAAIVAGSAYWRTRFGREKHRAGSIAA